VAARGARAAGETASHRVPGLQQASEAGAWIAAFVQRLRELGWTEGRNVTIVFQWSEGRPERYREIASRVRPAEGQLIVTWGTPAALATKQATGTIPIVVALASAGSRPRRGMPDTFKSDSDVNAVKGPDRGLPRQLAATLEWVQVAMAPPGPLDLLEQRE
jgi:hypothetical protein